MFNFEKKYDINEATSFVKDKISKEIRKRDLLEIEEVRGSLEQSIWFEMYVRCPAGEDELNARVGTFVNNFFKILNSESTKVNVFMIKDITSGFLVETQEHVICGFVYFEENNEELPDLLIKKDLPEPEKLSFWKKVLSYIRKGK